MPLNGSGDAGGSVEDRDITFVLQGGIGGADDVRYTTEFMKTLFPDAKFILATQESQIKRVSDYKIFDEVVLTSDPGPLPGVKFGGEPHNVNRQIASAQAGLAAVTTFLAVKMRTDSYFSSRKILDYWSAWKDRGRGAKAKGRSRILVSSLFTLNPGYDERIPFHVSDWISFGETADVQRMWSCPPYDFRNATHYERHDYAVGSLPREREFRSRYATEQWLTLNYLYPKGDFPIGFHNDYSASIHRLFEQELIDNFIVVHPYDIDLRMPKHSKLYRSKYANLRNYSFEDWKKLVQKERDTEGPLTGHTAWPRTPLEQALYMFFRRKRRVKRHERRA